MWGAGPGGEDRQAEGTESMYSGMVTVTGMRGHPWSGRAWWVHSTGAGLAPKEGF